MKVIFGIISIFFVNFISPNPIVEPHVDLVVDEDFYPKELVKYEGNHEIVNLLLPLNSLNFNESESFESNSIESDDDSIIFFVEADVTDDGKRIDQGLYILKGNKATKLLDHGRDVAASADDSTSAFFGAKDGIYIYKDEKTEKYGSLNDSIIQIAKETEGEVLYILTEDHELYKVSDAGNKKDKVIGIDNPQEFVLDYKNNIYFYSSDKVINVHTDDGIVKIDGLPANPSSLKLVKPPFILQDGVPVVIDSYVYIVYANGTSENGEIKIKPKYQPTAYAPEAAILQYYAYDKKIYEYNILALLLGTILEELKDYLNENKEAIQKLPEQRKAMKRN